MIYRTRKQLILALLAFAGAGVVLFWPSVQQGLSTRFGPPEWPPIISVAAAQQRVPFTLWAPGGVPSGGRFLGVRVIEPKVRNAAQTLAWARSHRRTRTTMGTGVGVGWRGGRQVIIGLPGSPAARAGIGLDPVVLLALDGVPVTNSRPLTPAVLHRPRPLQVTYLSLEGRPRTVVLNHETFTVTTGLPNLHYGLRAALIFMVHGRSAALIENRAESSVTPAPSGARQLEIAGNRVYVSGPLASPAANWTSGQTEFRLDNPHGALNQADVADLIRSLHPSGS